MSANSSIQGNPIGPKRRRSLTAVKTVGAVAACAIGVTIGLSATGSTSTGESTASILSDAERSAADEFLTRQLSEVSSAQRAAVADGDVTRAELSGLAKSADLCATSAGAPPIELQWSDEGFVRTQEFDLRISEDELLKQEQATDRCWHEHVGVAEQIRALDLVPSEADQRAFNERVTQCLIDAGEQVRGWPGTHVDIDPSIEATCVDRAHSAQATKE